MVNAFPAAGAGFLLAVLWFDLMFDVQAIGHGTHDLPEQVLASIAGYYARVTASARPMNRLISVVMLASVAAVVVQIARGDETAWACWASLAALIAPIALAGGRTLPAAARLGTRTDDTARQSALARAVLREHIACACSIALVLVLQLAFA